MLSTTEVSFPSGAINGHSVVTAVLEMADGRIGVATAATPFHPVDHTWPDQPGDTGTLADLPVTDCVTAATQGSEILVGQDIPVRRGDDEWSWLVLHVLEDTGQRRPKVGDRVALEVDRGRRRALSAGHTGCHLTAFALNRALAGFWRKDVRTDSLGAPDFDSLAMDSSRIDPSGSTDVYRIGKSLRKKGFTPGEYEGLEETVNAQLAQWLSTGAPVEVITPGALLTDKRQWMCALPDGEASVACGGTHLNSLKQLRSLTVSVDAAETGMTVTTIAKS